VTGLRCCAVKHPSLHRLLFFPLSAHFSGLPHAERWYLMFSDSCSFCCQCWCPWSKTELSNCLQWEHTPPAAHTCRLAAAVSVCVCIYIYAYLYISLHVCVCAFAHHPDACRMQRCTTVHLQPGPCPRGLCELYTVTAGIQPRPPRPRHHPACGAAADGTTHPSPESHLLADLKGHSLPSSLTPRPVPPNQGTPLNWELTKVQRCHGCHTFF